MPGKSSILVESQSVLESIDLAESGIKLVYHSARAKDYLSTIQLQLTPDQVPTSLLKVHIRITIEGVVHEKVFEADPNIRYTYAWDGLNEYRQVRIDIKVFFMGQTLPRLHCSAVDRVPEIWVLKYWILKTQVEQGFSSFFA